MGIYMSRAWLALAWRQAQHVISHLHLIGCGSFIPRLREAGYGWPSFELLVGLVTAGAAATLDCGDNMDRSCAVIVLSRHQ